MDSGEKGPPKLDLSWGGESLPASSTPDWSGQGPGEGSEAPNTPHFGADSAMRYERRGLLGQGGMGRVVTVLDRRLRREVALKEVAQRTGSTRDAEARLAREAWITAQLEHPGIVPVHDAGRTEDGRLYYTMRLIRGKSLEDLLSEAPGLEERLGLLRPFLDACQAVAYAHSLGIVHRDLKPANIMIGEFGETQVVDWGLARPSRSARGDPWREKILPDADLTQQVSGAVAGTPAYMSPEQASGEPADERSDVWGLGAVLYVLLTGRPPFLGEDSREVLKKLRTRAPAPIVSLEPEAPVELVAIAGRALRRDPEERYRDARDMAGDVIRYVDGRHVRAYRYTPTDHLRRFLSAWRFPVAVGVVAAAAVISIGILAALQTAEERDRARDAEARMAAALEHADDNLALALIQQARFAARAGARPEAEVLAAHALALGETPEARGVLAAFDTVRPSLRSEVDASALPCSEYNFLLTADGADVVCLSTSQIARWKLSPLQEVWSRPLNAQWAFLNEGAGEIMVTGQDIDQHILFLKLEDGSLLRELPVHSNPEQVTFASGGAFALNHTNRLDAETGTHTPVAICDAGEWARAATALSEDRFVWVCPGGQLKRGALGGPFDVLPLTSEQIIPIEVDRMTISADERWAVAYTFRGDLMLVDLERFEVAHYTATGMGTIRDVVISPDNRLIAITGERGGVRLWHRSTGTWLGRLPTEQARRLHFTDSTTLRVLSETLQHWHIPETLRPDRMHVRGGFTGTAFSPDGTMLCGASGDGRVRVWSLQDGAVGHEPVFTEQLSTNNVSKDCDFTADNTRLLATALGHDGIAVTEAEHWRRSETLKIIHTESWPYFRRLGALQGGLVFGTSYHRSGPEVWRLGQEGTLDFLRVAGRHFAEAETNHDRTAAVLTDHESTVYVLRAGEPPTLTEGPQRDGLRAVDITNDGDRIALGLLDQIELYAMGTGEVLRTLGPTEGSIREVSFSPDDRYLAAGQSGGVVHLWEVETGALVAVLRGHNELVSSIAFSSDRALMATASWDGHLRLWGLSSLHTPADELVGRFEGAWKITLEEALAAEVD